MHVLRNFFRLLTKNNTCSVHISNWFDFYSENLCVSKSMFLLFIFCILDCSPSNYCESDWFFFSSSLIVLICDMFAIHHWAYIKMYVKLSSTCMECSYKNSDIIWGHKKDSHWYAYLSWYLKCFISNKPHIHQLISMHVWFC